MAIIESDICRFDRYLWLVNKFQENEKHHDTDVQALMNGYKQKFFGPPEGFPIDYNTPENFRAGWESKDRDIPMYPDVELPEQRIYFDEEDDFSFVPDDYGSGLPKDPEELFNGVYQQQLQDVPDLNSGIEVYGNEMEQRPLYLETNDIPKDLDVGGNGQPVMYTEGGMVYAPNARDGGDGSPNTKSNVWETGFGRLLEKFNLGFKRPERLDVKKPGPRFDDVNHKPFGINTIRAMVYAINVLFLLQSFQMTITEAIF